MLHRSLRNITADFHRMEVALCGLATVAASIYVNPGGDDPDLHRDLGLAPPRLRATRNPNPVSHDIVP